MITITTESFITKYYQELPHRFSYTERELLELLNMERSTFYDRKKEAIMLLGVSLWGYAIPQFKGIIQTDEFGKDETIPDYFLS